MNDPMSIVWMRVQTDLEAIHCHGEPTPGDVAFALQETAMGWAFGDAERFERGLEQLRSLTVGAKTTVQLPTLVVSVTVEVPTATATT
jgi:hypothetical protein